MAMADPEVRDFEDKLLQEAFIAHDALNGDAFVDATVIPSGCSLTAETSETSNIDAPATLEENIKAFKDPSEAALAIVEEQASQTIADASRAGAATATPGHMAEQHTDQVGESASANRGGALDAFALQSKSATETPPPLTAAAPEGTLNTKATPESGTVHNDRLEPFNAAALSSREAFRSTTEDVQSQIGLKHKTDTASDLHTQPANSSGMEMATQIQPVNTIPTTPPGPAEWLKDAIKNAKRANRAPLNRGDTLFIPDLQNASQACLLQSELLSQISPVMHALLLSSGVEAGNRKGVKHFLTLEELSGKNTMPALVHMPLDSAPPFAAGSTTAPEQIKSEAGVSNASPPRSEDSTSWAEAYTSFFRILSPKPHVLSTADLSDALAQVESVLQIAQSLEALPKLQINVSILVTPWIDLPGEQFYRAIAEAPLLWLKVAIALEQKLIFREAFVHLVGAGAAIDGAPLPDVPDAVRAAIDREIQKLQKLTMTAFLDLSHLTVNTPSVKKNGSLVPVSRSNQPARYYAVNIFRDWVGQHIAYIRDSSNSGTIPEESELCNHGEEGLCATVAGFFRMLYAADDDYLAADQVAEDWCQEFPKVKGASAAIKDTLRSLKTMAEEIAAPFVQSYLHGSAELEYLSCVEVGPGDVPWEVEGVKDEDDDVEMEDDD